jgi:probable F420-dependent oxidoreductase
MKFGINALNFGPGANPNVLREWAQFAENSGFHFLMISDHVAITPDVQNQFPAPFYDPFVTLGWIAAQTTRIEIGTSVTILPYRNPLLTARMAANLDQLSSGRFFLGVGVGWARQEFEVLDLPFEKRGRMTDEYLEIILTYWKDDVAAYDGEFLSFEKLQTGPLPSREPHPPIWVGGRSDGALKRAVRYGDAWHPYNVSIDWLREVGLPKLHRIAGAEDLSLPALCPRIAIKLTGSTMVERDRKAGHGTIDQIHSDLEALRELGASHILLDTYTGHPEQTLYPQVDWELLTRLSEQVVDLENQTLR